MLEPIRFDNIRDTTNIVADEVNIAELRFSKEAKSNT
jgi:hypothetical protein